MKAKVLASGPHTGQGTRWTRVGDSQVVQAAVYQSVREENLQVLVGSTSRTRTRTRVSHSLLHGYMVMCKGSKGPFSQRPLLHSQAWHFMSSGQGLGEGEDEDAQAVSSSQCKTGILQVWTIGWSAFDLSRASRQADEAAWHRRGLSAMQAKRAEARCGAKQEVLSKGKARPLKENKCAGQIS